MASPSSTLVEFGSEDERESISQIEGRLTKFKDAVRSVTKRLISLCSMEERSLVELNTYVLLYMLSFLDMRDLISWRATCHFARSLGERLLRTRSRAIISPFTNDSFRFENMMRRYKAVYINQRALACIHGDDLSLEPLVLDLAVGRRWATQLERFLKKKEHYKLWRREVHFVPTHADDSDDEDDDGVPFKINPGYFRNVVLHRPGLTINLFVTRAYSISILPYAWSTLMMNAVSPDHIFSLYPAYTLDKHGLVSSQYLRRASDLKFASHLVKDLELYGYTHSTELTSKEVRDTDAEPSLPWRYRPIVVRHMRDTAVMHINFATCPTVSNAGLGMIGPERNIFWRLGGLDKTYRGDVPFIVEFKAATALIKGFVF